tara:strand:+ start:3934 stop:4428 length:495 start_codon:yes stop_codon:yes gene_type:complete
MTILKAFPPIIGDDPHTLILGTMPGIKSLKAGEYYAHPRNKFWKLMADILGFDVLIDYDQRVECLKVQGIAVWDVLHQCEREGSLDSAIKNAYPNNFEQFLSDHSTIKKIIFDSGTAETIFNRHFKHLRDSGVWEFIRVPSPSPAHAARRYEEKLLLWQKAFSK